MGIEEELELVPPECRSEVLEEYENRKSVDAVFQILLKDGRDKATRVHVTFYTHLDKKVVQMHLDGRHCLEQVTQKAAELFPGVQWRIYSGNQHHAEQELLSSDQMFQCIQHSLICRFFYLLIRLERRHPGKSRERKCDNCGRSIIGHRFECTECSNYSICQSCEARSVHSEHVMLRIVSSKAAGKTEETHRCILL
ncbi:unnamed protein product [Caenorhabditis brenneri]